MARVWTQLVVVALLAGGGWGGFEVWRGQAGAAVGSGAAQRPAPGVVVAPAVLDRVERTVQAVGVARPVRSVELAALSEGRVVEIGFESGAQVAEGQVLMRLDDAAERFTVVEAEADLTRARNAYDRARALLDQRRIPQADFDNARADLSRAEAALDRARKDLEERTLRAPFAGRVGFRTVEVGAVVRQSTVIANLADILALDVDFAIPERFYGEVQPGSDVRAATEIFAGQQFVGELTAVGARIDTVSRTFTARARIPNADLRLPADAFMRVTLVLAARTGVLVPEEAVVSEGGATFVYAVVEDRARRQPVQVGVRTAGRAEILSGVAPGELLVTRGLQKIGDGRPVRVIETETVAAPAAPGA